MAWTNETTNDTTTFSRLARIAGLVGVLTGFALSADRTGATAQSGSATTTTALWSARVVDTDQIVKPLPAPPSSVLPGTIPIAASTVSSIGSVTTVKPLSAKRRRATAVVNTDLGAPDVTVPRKKKSTPTTDGAGTDSAPNTSEQPSVSGSAIPASVWAALRKCESGGRYDANTGNGFYGAYQFVVGTWRALGYSGYPHEAPPALQDEAAQRLQAKAGWGQWPSCSRKLGLR